MIENLAFIALALLLLFFGAESLVRGSVSLALRASISPLIVGLTVVAFGTSSPELFVSVSAALSQQGDISVANAIGSNTFNIAVILGLAALVCPLPVHSQVIKIDVPIALGAVLLLLFLFIDQTIGRFEGLLLFAGIAAYIYLNVTIARGQAKFSAMNSADAIAKALPRRWGRDIAFIAAGLGVLIFGSHLLVVHAVALAEALEVSEAVIGLTIVSAGTSMPELATSLVAAVRKQPDIAIGNIVGSNIFNILAILGIASVVTPLYAPGVAAFDYKTMLVFTVLLFPLLYTGRLLHRLEGVALLALYGVYLYMLWPK